MPGSENSSQPFPPSFCIYDPVWQGRRDSNPQPTVLETATLPIELLPFATEPPPSQTGTGTKIFVLSSPERSKDLRSMDWLIGFFHSLSGNSFSLPCYLQFSARPGIQPKNLKIRNERSVFRCACPVGNRIRSTRRNGPPFDGPAFLNEVYQSRMSPTRPAPTVRPPSRIAKRIVFSIAIGVISSIPIEMLSPGITISTPSGRTMVPVTSVVRK